MPTTRRSEADPRRAPIRFVEELGGGLADAGMPRIAARAFAALLGDGDGQMTAADLAAVLHVSPAAVSGAVSYLLRVGFIRRERERGSRRDIYVVRDDAWHDLLLSAQRTYAPLIAALERGRADPDTAPRAADRLALSAEFLRFIGAEMVGVRDRWDALLRARGIGPS